MQLVGDLRKRGAEILPEANLRVAAAGLLRDARETGVGQVGRQHRLEAAGPMPGIVGRMLRLRRPMA